MKKFLSWCCRSAVMQTGILILVVLLYFAYPFIVPRIVGRRAKGDQDRQEQGSSLAPWDKCGVFGDSYGALTCLFSALTFWGMIFTFMYQRKQNQEAREAIAKEHLPIMLVMPQGGALEFVLGVKCHRVTCKIRLFVNEENTSDVPVFGLMHRANISLPAYDDVKFIYGVDTADYVKPHKGFARKEEIVISNYEHLIAFLKTLIAHEISSRPKVLFARTYSGFLEAFGRIDLSCRMKLRKHKQKKEGIEELIRMLSENVPVTEEKLREVLGGVCIPVELVYLHDMKLRCCTRMEYEQFRC